jgi:hypothetical protein
MVPSRILYIGGVRANSHTTPLPRCQPPTEVDTGGRKETLLIWGGTTHGILWRKSGKEDIFSSCQYWALYSPPPFPPRLVQQNLNITLIDPLNIRTRDPPPPKKNPPTLLPNKPITRTAKLSWKESSRIGGARFLEVSRVPTLHAMQIVYPATCWHAIVCACP